MPRKKETITLSIPSGTREQLEEIARRLSIFWGKSPSISGLLVAIAQQEFEVGEPFRLNTTQVGALLQAIRLLNDSGNTGEAQTLSRLLLERGEFEAPMRQLVLQKVSQPTEAWLTIIEQHTQNQQPFLLLYTNSQGEDLAYTVRYAEIAFEEEKGFYLYIWCDETEDLKNPEFSELIHNRCLRLDRIKTILPINGHWRREGLDFLEVYLHFYGGMVKAYEPKARSINKDIRSEVIDGVRQVVKRVPQPFWLIREVLRYGDDCVVVSPESVRSRVREKLKHLCQRYDLEVSS
ncbi:MAG: WYL domain-containing protein [Scytonema sp. PMC 1070.18]|nr:WYL domain-containing protein [Scytonema sp. PMC 1070.18]